jgi:hypothetical protein
MGETSGQDGREPPRPAAGANDEWRQMWVGVRALRQRGDPDWEGYLRATGREHLPDVRTVDPWLSPRLSETFWVESLDDVWERVRALPAPEPGRSYHLLVTDALASAPLEHRRLVLLGHDLSERDCIGTSSLFNCGLWTGILEPIVARALPNGLLTLEDAALAQSLLPEAWNRDPHADVTVWAMYEVLPDS